MFSLALENNILIKKKKSVCPFLSILKPYLCLNALSRDHQIVIRASSKIGLSELVIDSLFTGRVA